MSLSVSESECELGLSVPESDRVCVLESLSASLSVSESGNEQRGGRKEQRGGGKETVPSFSP